VEFTDQCWLAERVKPRPFVVLGNRAPITIEAHNITPASAGLDRLGSLPRETAPEKEVVGIVTP
jgi:hypothetical protein